MTVAQQVQSRNSLNALSRNPANVLANNVINADDARGHLTRREQIYYSAHNNNIRVGTQGYCRNANGMGNFSPIQINALVTPTRARGTPQRLVQLQRFRNNGDVNMWVTTQQTGCTVIILDWGGNSYSMLHLQPYAAAEYNWLSQKVLPIGTPRGARHAAKYLRKETTQVVNLSRNNNNNPARYILVQSNSHTLAGGRIQIIGLPRNGGFDFYVQKRNNAGVITLVRPQWQDWRWYKSYQSVAS